MLSTAVPSLLSKAVRRNHWVRWPLLPSEIRMVRLGQAYPLILVMFRRVVGTDLFLPLRGQAPVGDKGGQRCGKHLRVLHGHFELQSLQTGIGGVTRDSASTADSALALLVRLLRCL